VTNIGNALAADPTAQVILSVVPGTASTFMRSDAAPSLSQAISPTMTGTWNFTPSADTVPVTINAANLATGNMQTWNPLTNADSVVTNDGDMGIGEPTPTANLSIKARGVNAQTFIADNAYAWWDCGDIDGNGTNNSAYSDAQTDIIAQVDKTGNGHNLPASIPSTTKWTLHKAGGALPGPNNTAWLTPGSGNGRWAPWLGSAFGNPTGWTAFIVVANTSFSGGGGGVYFLRGTVNHDVTLGIPDPDFVLNPRPAAFINAGLGGGTNHTLKKDLGVPTYWIAVAAEWAAFSWRMSSGIHEGWNQGVAMANPTDNGGTASLTTSSWDRLFQSTVAGSLTAYTYSEIILFDRDLTESERLSVQNYLDVKYGAAAPGAAQPLTDWKDSTGTIDSIVDEDINFGFGTSAPAAKVNVLEVTEQLRLSYNASSYLGFTVGSTGITALNSAGTSSGLSITTSTGGGSTGASASILGANSSGTTGGVAFTAGTGASGKAGGDITFVSGSTINANAGSMVFTGGDVTSGNGSGGVCTFTAGHGKGTGAGGQFSLLSGGGGDTGTSGNGGPIGLTAGNGGLGGSNGGLVDIRAGSAQGGNGNGGNITLTPGSKFGTGINGQVIIVNLLSTFGAKQTTSSLTSDRDYTWPDMDGTILLSDTLGGGTVNSIPIWKTPFSLGDSSASEDAAEFEIAPPATAIFDGAYISLRSGSATSGNEGSLYLATGNATDSAGGANGGYLSINTGNGDHAGTSSGGDISIATGSGGSVGGGGTVSFNLGFGGGVSGPGGSFIVNAGSATTLGDGGAIVFSPGAGRGAGVNGTVSLLDPTTANAATFATNLMTAARTYAFPDANGTFALTSGIPVGANPTATIGVAAVNGSAVTFMRSDAAPSFDMTIARNWTAGVHTFAVQDVHTLGIDLSTSGVIQSSVANSGTNIGCLVRDSVSLTASRRMFEVDWWTGAAYQEAFGVWSQAGSAKGMRLAYDSSNHWTTTVNSSGTVNSNSTGAYNLGAATSYQLTAGTTMAFLAPTSLTLSTASIIFLDGAVLSNIANTTGLKIGAAGDKLGFYSVAPVVQPVNTVAIDTALTNLGLRASGGVANFDTDVKVAVLGNGLYVKEGANATMGIATLVAGVAVVATTKVTANSRILLTRQTVAGTVGTSVDVTARTAGTSFTITAAGSVLDTSTVAWFIAEPA
jgi:hypothetical protein